MRIILLLCITSLLMLSCLPKKRDRVNTEVAILDDVFMDIIDTIPYKYRSLRPAPHDSVYAHSDTLNVAITPFLRNIRKWKLEINSSALKSENKALILALFEKSSLDSTEVEISVNQFKKTGRYRLFPYNKKSISIDTLSAIGKIEFSRTYFDEQYGITVTTIRDQIKNGVVKLVLMEKRDSRWQQKEEHVLEIW